MRATFDASLVEGKIPDLPTDSIHWVCYKLGWGVSEIITNNTDSGVPKTTSLRLGLVSGREQHFIAAYI